MDKILVMVRTSTDAQSIADQHREMEDFCVSEGWDKENIVWVEEQGASAAKVDDTYRAMIDKVKECVDKDPDIKCFAVWHLNRLARTEEVWIEIKTFFVNRRIQIICKNPYLKLLTPSGEVDQGIELAMGLLAILSKQDQAERKEKFRRAKSSMAKKGQYIGGNTRKYGYKIVDKTFVEDEVESAVVRQIFQLYASGEYSVYTLSNEMKERGYDINSNHISRIIRSRAYIGEEVSESGMHYPPIISRELFEEVAKVRETNKIIQKRGSRIVLGAKLVKCPTCGATCTSNSKHFVCSRHSHHGPCPNGFALKHSVVDDLLCRVASSIHMNYLIDLTEQQEEEYRKTMEMLQQKVKVRQDKIAQEKEKIERIEDLYVEGRTSHEKLAYKRLKIEEGIRVHQDAINSLQERIAAIAGILETKSGDEELDIDSILDEMELVDRYEIIHKHIKSLVAKQISYGERDPRTHRPNAVEIVITTTLGSVWKYMYFPKYYKGHNLYVWNGRKWVGDEVSPALL